MFIKVTESKRDAHPPIVAVAEIGKPRTVSLNVFSWLFQLHDHFHASLSPSATQLTDIFRKYFIPKGTAEHLFSNRVSCTVYNSLSS